MYLAYILDEESPIWLHKKNRILAMIFLQIREISSSRFMFAQAELVKLLHPQFQPSSAARAIRPGEPLLPNRAQPRFKAC